MTAKRSSVANAEFGIRNSELRSRDHIAANENSLPRQKQSAAENAPLYPLNKLLTAKKNPPTKRFAIIGGKGTAFPIRFRRIALCAAPRNSEFRIPNSELY